MGERGGESCSHGGDRSNDVRWGWSGAFVLAMLLASLGAARAPAGVGDIVRSLIVLAVVEVFARELNATSGGSLGAARIVTSALAAMWIAVMSHESLASFGFYRSSLDNFLDLGSGMSILLLPLGTAAAAILAAAMLPWLSRARWRWRWIRLGAGWLCAVVVVGAVTRARHHPSPDRFVESLPLIATLGGEGTPPAMERLHSFCTYRVRQGPIELRRDAAHGLWILSPRMGWKTACVEEPDGRYARVRRTFSDLKDGLAPPWSWTLLGTFGALIALGGVPSRRRRALGSHECQSDEAGRDPQALDDGAPRAVAVIDHARAHPYRAEWDVVDRDRGEGSPRAIADGSGLRGADTLAVPLDESPREALRVGVVMVLSAPLLVACCDGIVFGG